jgi:hypothetical protein
MLYTVEVRSAGQDIADAMNDMRIWLDHFGYEPDTFRQSKPDAGVLFRLDFKTEREAVTFAAAFGGRITSPPI